MQKRSSDISATLGRAELTAAATKIQASFRGHQVRRRDELHQREEELYRQMEQLHTARRPRTATDQGECTHLPQVVGIGLTTHSWLWLGSAHRRG
ncbi:hypothetical protein FJT64_002900 [Amphibalanus amphitrite]|uniref:Uncharacterized protein n=1 Tax=Amphibalanus amphitrite TaxID=1232801 RepID=A0A6A4W7Q3_AMPAM|nr:hypothetical protein FJT64_002900 [Amphibalanus amphitrite]